MFCVRLQFMGNQCCELNGRSSGTLGKNIKKELCTADIHINGPFAKISVYQPTNLSFPPKSFPLTEVMNRHFGSERRKL